MTGNVDVERDLAECRRALRQVATEWSRAEDEERRRIAAGLHDDLGQVLATIGLGLHEMRRWAGDGDHLAAIDDTKRLLDQAVELTRTLTFRLLSSPLDEGSLHAALRGLAVRLRDDRGVACAVRFDGSVVGLSEEHAVVVFRVVRELLTNIAKHSEATKAVVQIAALGEGIRVTVSDDGRGFAARDGATWDRSGIGLLIARERLAEIGGSMEIDSTNGGGSKVVVVVPSATSASKA
jgi:signal transduction histidine kinase